MNAPAYVIGRVTDGGGNPLVGVRLVCYNDWHRYPVVVSGAGGEYNFPVIQASTVWNIAVVDELDQAISPITPVEFDTEVSCRFILDWVRLF